MATKIYLQDNLKYLRDLHRYTYPEMAKIAGCTVASMKSYELRGTTPPLEVIIKLADKFGVTMDQLVRVKLQSTSKAKMPQTHVSINDFLQLKKDVEELKRSI